MKMNRKNGDIVLDALVYGILIFLTLVTIIPFLQVITISLSPSEVINKFGLHLFPTQIYLDGYMKVIKYPLIWSAYTMTIVKTALGTGLSVLLYIIGAYPLSKKYLPNLRLWLAFFVFTMFFSGGLIPDYLLVSKTLHMKNTLWALVIPPAMGTFTLIIVRNFFMTIPDEIEQSAKIDGANDIMILFRIVVPLSTPVIATIALWTLVGHWNRWFDCMLYMNDQKNFVLPLVLRNILLLGQVDQMKMDTKHFVNNDTMKMAAIIVSILPIICIYPFLQKYFVKGVMIGAIKG